MLQALAQLLLFPSSSQVTLLQFHQVAATSSVATCRSFDRSLRATPLSLTGLFEPLALFSGSPGRPQQARENVGRLIGVRG